MSLMPESEYKRWKAVVINGLQNPELCRDWDVEFLSDYVIKFDKYKRHTFVSPNQAEQFERIEEYLKEELGSMYEE